MEIRSGQSTSFWYDVWSPLGRLSEQLGERGFIDLGIPKNQTVAEVIINHRRRRHRQALLNQIETEIEKVGLNRSEEPDRSLWRHHGDTYQPKFSSHQTWQHTRQTHPTWEWAKGIWFTHSTPKHSLLTWLAFHGRLATGDKLLSWNVGAQVGCIFCGEAVETRDHLFFSCPYSSHIWFSLTKGILRDKYTTSWNILAPLLLDTTVPKLQIFTFRFKLEYVFQITLHSIWRERNGRRHGETPAPAATLVKFIDKEVRNRFSTIRESRNFEEGLRYWFYTRSL